MNNIKFVREHHNSAETSTQKSTDNEITTNLSDMSEA